MSGILDALNKGLRLLKHGDDDFFDRISSRYSVALCIVFAVVVSTGEFVLHTGRFVLHTGGIVFTYR